MNPVRLDAQVLRDSLLHLSGTLDPRLGGPTLDPASGEKFRRRSLYFNQTRDESNLFLEMFDNANVLDCYRRAESIVPQQALALMNAQTSLASAAIIARRFHQPDDEAFVRTAFQALLATTPNQEEVQICLGALHELGTGEKARTAFVHTLLNHHDFITVR
jgi:predicted 3-demethylubiquinone-9 3-methyltransferase (glyoxalase superfamily)